MARDLDDVTLRRAVADSVGFVVDAAPYFDALVEACERATRSILIVGWDVHSRLRLRRGADDEIQLRDFLEDLVRRRDGLRIHILAWDFSMIYALEREALPVVRFDWGTHPRISFALDAAHPPGASQHRKLVVVDDRVAFCGGIDLTMRRWDTPDHAPGEDRRVDPDGTAYRPFHDVAAVVSGPSAVALGDVVREQWRRATGDAIATASAPASDPWPPSIDVAVRDVRLGIALTEPEHDGREEVRQIESAYLAAIAGARRSIYLENQFFTAHTVVEALSARLAEPDGPEVLVVGPRLATGWLEQATMGVLRSRALARLQAVAGPERFRLCWPYRRGLDREDSINVHSKVAVFDDRILTIGSANLANRSMGLDAECNLWLDAGTGDAGRADVRAAVAGLRARLLGEHLGVEPSVVESAVERRGLLAGVAEVAASAGTPATRGLRDVERQDDSSVVARVVPDESLLDPERPIAPAELLRRLAPESRRSDVRSRGVLRWGLVGAALVGLTALALAWRLGPLGDWLAPERITGWIESYRESPLALLWSVLVYVALGVLCFPLTALIVQTAVVFDPWIAWLHAMCGALASGGVGWGVGRVLGRERARRFLATYASRLERFIGEPGVVSMAAVRFVPIAPYSVVNVAAGALGVPARAFFVGTALGLAPGVAALTLFGDRVAAAVRDPSPLSIAVAAGAGAVALGVAAWLRRKGAGPADDAA